MDTILEVAAIRKAFGPTVALDEVSFAVLPNTIVGLLGPNGAGKTTLMKVIVGLVHADGGRVQLRTDPPVRIGASIDSPGFYPYLTGRQNLIALGMTAGGSYSAVARRADELLAEVGLSEAADRKFGGYSTGMGQRLGIAAALLAAPELLILDEPASGLDPAGVAPVRDVLGELRAEGCTVLVSSHLLGEVDKICDSVAIIDRGRLLADGPVAALAPGRVAWRLSYLTSEDAARASAVLAPHFDTSVAGHVVSAVPRQSGSAPPLDLVAPLGLLPHEVKLDQPSLEEVYLRLTSASRPGAAA